MSSRYKVLTVLLAAAPCAFSAGVLRVCADAKNLPYSNQSEQGFENKLAQLVAHDLGKKVEYLWWPQRQFFLRYTLLSGRCDVVMGVNAGASRMQTTHPYYRSSFVFVSRPNLGPAPHSLDDARLKHLQIGLHVVGDDFASVPPQEALAKRGIIKNVVGFPIYGDYADENPRAPLLDAVAQGRVDVAIAWGPLAGYFAKSENPPLRVSRLERAPQDRSLPFSFDIAMGVRKNDTALRKELDDAIARRREDINRLLRSYGVPMGTSYE